MTDPEFAVPVDFNPNPEPLQQINADDDPAESSLHVITIGQHHISQIGGILQSKLSMLEHNLKTCNEWGDRSAYWVIRAKEINHEIAETKALIKMILGAESIDIKHHVNPLT